MFREIFLSAKPVLYFEPNLFQEIQIPLQVPIGEKHWSKIEPNLLEILEILQEGDKSLKSTDSKKLLVKFLESDAVGNFYFETNSPIELKQTNEIVLYKKHKNIIMEFIFELLSVEKTKIICKPIVYRRFQEQRKHERIPNFESQIYAKDFQVLQLRKNASEYLTKNVSSIFQMIENEYKLVYPNLELFYLYDSANLTLEEKFVALEQKPIFAKITDQIESYPGDFLNLKEYYKKQDLYNLKINVLKEKKIRSFIIFPLFFKLNNKKIFLGCGYLWTVEPYTIPTSEIFVFEEIESKISSEILAKENTEFLEKQEIINVSKGGVLFKITNLEIAMAILTRPKFSATICKPKFRDAKLNFYARSVYRIEQDYYIGSEILGNPYLDENIQKYLNLIQEKMS